MPVRHNTASTPPIVTAFIHAGVPVLTSGPMLDAAAATALATAAATLTTGGPVLVDLAALAEWTSDGFAALHQATHPHTSRRRIAFVAPPAGLLASNPAASGFDMFPSTETGVVVLTRPPGALPHPAAGGQPIRFAHRSFEPEASSLFAARHWLRGLLREWGHTHVTDRAVVAASELAAGASAAASSTVDISTYLWRQRGGALMLTTSVFDTHPDTTPSHNSAHADGSGLRLVASLVDHLGCYRQHSTPAGKCTWFTIGLARARASGL